MTDNVSLSPCMHEIGTRVSCTVLFNNPGYYKEESNLPGTIISAFENGGGFTYRVELDIEWGARHPHSKGKKIIAGNIPHSRLTPLNELPTLKRR